MRIIPFNIKNKAWHNYSNYLSWADSEISSLEGYLHYFNPNYVVLNKDLVRIDSATWERLTKSNLEKYLQLLELCYPQSDSAAIKVKKGETTEHYYICYPNYLHFRQGIYITKPNTYMSFEALSKTEYDDLEWNDLIENKKIIHVPEGQILWSKRYAHGLQNWQNEQLKQKSAYLCISQPYAALYQINSISNGMEFLYIQSGQKVLGTNLTFTFELAPTRYFITKENLKHWTGSSWSVIAANWSSTTSDMDMLVQNKNNNVWTNSYPLMHNLYFIQDKTDGSCICEDFIMDEETKVENVNIANHATVMYTIKGNIQEEDFDNSIWEQVNVSII